MLFYTEAISVNKERHRSWFLFLDNLKSVAGRPLFVFFLKLRVTDRYMKVFVYFFHQKYFMRVRCFNFEVFWSILLFIKKI